MSADSRDGEREWVYFLGRVYIRSEEVLELAEDVDEKIILIIKEIFFSGQNFLFTTNQSVIDISIN